MPQTDKPQPDMTGPRLVYFAAERTLLSWVRVALGLMAFGFVVDRFELFPALQHPSRQHRADASRSRPPLDGYGPRGRRGGHEHRSRHPLFPFCRSLPARGQHGSGQRSFPGVLFTVLIALGVSGIVVYLIMLSR